MNFLHLEKSVCTNQVEPQDNALVKWPQPESDLGSGFHKNQIRSKFDGHRKRELCCKYEYWIFLQFLRLLFVYNHCFNNKSNKKLSKEGGAKRWANSSCKDVIIVRRPGPSTELPCSKEAARAMMRLFALCLLFTSWQWFCPAVHPASLLKQQLQKAWSVWRRMFMAQFSNELSLSLEADPVRQIVREGV